MNNKLCVIVAGLAVVASELMEHQIPANQNVLAQHQNLQQLQYTVSVEQEFFKPIVGTATAVVAVVESKENKNYAEVSFK